MPARTWLIVGASRGIGLEFVRQLLARGDRVIATVRDVEKAAELWKMAGSAPRGGCQLLLCDVRSDESITVSCASIYRWRRPLIVPDLCARAVRVAGGCTDRLRRGERRNLEISKCACSSMRLDTRSHQPSKLRADSNSHREPLLCTAYLLHDIPKS